MRSSSRRGGSRGTRPARDPTRLAASSGLRHVSDRDPGLSRRRRGRGFSYHHADGTIIRDPAVIARIKALAVPPAWSDVWICPSADGHIQATGRDARGRKQYRYHERWRAQRDREKFDGLIAFGRALPRIRARCDADLRLAGLPRAKVLAAVVCLLGSTLIRVGNDEYARSNHSFGLTTLNDRHAQVKGSRTRFRFRGKGGRLQEVEIEDRRLARIVRRCQQLPGRELFKYRDETGELRDVSSQDVNDYLHELTGADFTAKDFRTWAGTVVAYRALGATRADQGGRAPRGVVAAAMRDAADSLGNTPAVARGSYVHPAVIEAYSDGLLGDVTEGTVENATGSPNGPDVAEERAIIALLERHRKDGPRPRPAGGRGARHRRRTREARARRPASAR